MGSHPAQWLPSSSSLSARAGVQGDGGPWRGLERGGAEEAGRLQDGCVLLYVGWQCVSISSSVAALIPGRGGQSAESVSSSSIHHGGLVVGRCTRPLPPGVLGKGWGVTTEETPARCRPGLHHLSVGSLCLSRCPKLNVGDAGKMWKQHFFHRSLVVHTRKLEKGGDVHPPLSLKPPPPRPPFAQTSHTYTKPSLHTLNGPHRTPLLLEILTQHLPSIKDKKSHRILTLLSNPCVIKMNGLFLRELQREGVGSDVRRWWWARGRVGGLLWQALGVIIAFESSATARGESLCFSCCRQSISARGKHCTPLLLSAEEL